MPPNTSFNSVFEVQEEIYYRYVRIRASIDGGISPKWVDEWRKKVGEEALAASNVLKTCNSMRWKITVPALVISAIHHVHHKNTPQATPSTLSEDPAPYLETRWKGWLGRTEDHDISHVDCGPDQWWAHMRPPLSEHALATKHSWPSRRMRSSSPEERKEDEPAAKKMKMKGKARQVEVDTAAEAVADTDVKHSESSDEFEIPTSPRGRRQRKSSDTSDSGPRTIRVCSNPPAVAGLKAGERVGEYHPPCEACREKSRRCLVILRARIRCCIPCNNSKTKCSASRSQRKVTAPSRGSVLDMLCSSAKKSRVATSQKAEDYLSTTAVSPHDMEARTIIRRRPTPFHPPSLPSPTSEAFGHAGPIDGVIPPDTDEEENGAEDLFEKISRLVALEMASLGSTVKEAADRNAAAMDDLNKKITILQEEFRISQLELEGRIRTEFTRAQPFNPVPSMSTAPNTDANVIAQLRGEIKEMRALLEQARADNATLSDANQYLRQRIVDGQKTFVASSR